MDYFSPGPREFARKLSRQAVRRRQAALERTLAKAETELGLLGWQQADYDPDTQRQVQEIQNVEREQSRLTNEAAALGLKIRELQSARLAAQKEYEEQRWQVETERRRKREPYEALERQLAEKRKTEPNFVLRIPDLDRELRETQKLYSELLQRIPQTSQIRLDLARLRERTVAIPGEKSELRTQHLRTVTEIRALEEELEAAKPGVERIEEQLRQIDEEWAAREHALAEETKAGEAEKAALETRIEALEGAKVNPYQRIGQVLADNNIAPVNQPHALDKVKRLRFDRDELRQHILESEAASATEDPAIVRTSLLLWLVICVGALLLLAALLH